MATTAELNNASHPQQGNCWRTKISCSVGGMLAQSINFRCLYAAGLHALGQFCPVWLL